MTAELLAAAPPIVVGPAYLPEAAAVVPVTSHSSESRGSAVKRSRKLPKSECPAVTAEKRSPRRCTIDYGQTTTRKKEKKPPIRADNPTQFVEIGEGRVSEDAVSQAADTFIHNSDKKIGIVTGLPGSGKSTFVEAVKRRIEAQSKGKVSVTVVQMDPFYQDMLRQFPDRSQWTRMQWRGIRDGMVDAVETALANQPKRRGRRNIVLMEAPLHGDESLNNDRARMAVETVMYRYGDAVEKYTTTPAPYLAETAEISRQLVRGTSGDKAITQLEKSGVKLQSSRGEEFKTKEGLFSAFQRLIDQISHSAPASAVKRVMNEVKTVMRAVLGNVEYAVIEKITLPTILQKFGHDVLHTIKRFAYFLNQELSRYGTDNNHIILGMPGTADRYV